MCSFQKLAASVMDLMYSGDSRLCAGKYCLLHCHLAIRDVDVGSCRCGASSAHCICIPENLSVSKGLENVNCNIASDRSF